MQIYYLPFSVILYFSMIFKQIKFCIRLLPFLIFFNDNVFAMSLFQYGNASALISGATEGDMTYRELKSKGNFGLGTFNGTSGEMVALNGEFYHIGQNGKTTPVDLNWKTPYVELIYFSKNKSYPLQHIANYNIFKELILNSFDTKNIPYALQIKGYFNSLELRSRSPRAAHQTKNIIEKKYIIKNISGTLVGFWFPEYLLNLTVPGFHLHFISDDKMISGHVLNVDIEKAEFIFLKIDTIELQFPQSSVFMQTKITAPTKSIYKKMQM